MLNKAIYALFALAFSACLAALHYEDQVDTWLHGSIYNYGRMEPLESRLLGRHKYDTLTAMSAVEIIRINAEIKIREREFEIEKAKWEGYYGRK